MDSLPAIQKPKPEIQQEDAPVPPYGTSTEPDTVPRTEPLKHRKIKQRHPFDIYEDQYETLKKISDEEEELGLPGSMSAMVRKGIDMYLNARKQGKV